MPTLDHVALQVTDLDAAIVFYTEKLGLRLQFKKVDEAHHEAFAFLELEGGNLELLQMLDADNRPVPRTPPQIRKPYTPHVAFASDDLNETLAALNQANVPIVAGPMEIPNAVRWLYLHDPDHNIIEYIQHLPAE